MVEQVREPAILRPSSAAEAFDYQRHHPPAELAPFVEHFWTITWSRPPDRPYTAQVLPYPSVNLSCTDTENDVTGVVRTLYRRHLTGTGYAVGARFRPGCFRPFLSGPVSALTGWHRPIGEVLGRDVAPTAARIAATDDRGLRVDLLAGFLTEGCPAPDPVAEDVAALVAAIGADPALIRVDRLAGRAGVSVRSLQRTFAEYVGIGPKWVIQRCRLQDAAARAAADPGLDWAGLAHELGFVDQAHFTRTFTATIGTSPAAYARQIHGGVSG